MQCYALLFREVCSESQALSASTTRVSMGQQELARKATCQRQAQAQA